MNIFKILKKKKIKLFLKIKEKNIICSKKLTSKIFYNLTYIYIKNNFLLINKLIKYNTFSNKVLQKNYILNDLNVYDDLFILKFLDNNFNNKSKTMININKNKKPLSIILLLKKIIFSNKLFFRLLKNEKAFLKLNIYNIYFFLFYYYMINSLSYISFLKLNKFKLKTNFFTLNLFLKKNLKKSFKFFFKNIIMFLYKYSLIKHKRRKLFKCFKKKKNSIFKNYKYLILGKYKKRYVRRKVKSKTGYFKRKKNYKKKYNIKQKVKHKNKYFKYNFYLKKKHYISKYKQIENNIFFKKNKKNIIRKKKKKFINKKKKLLKNLKKIKFYKKNKFIQKIKKNKKKQLKVITKISKFFKKSLKKKLLKKKNIHIFFFKKLFLKKKIVKRLDELAFKKDNKLINAASILKNNKKFKFLTFPLNSICKFFFKKSMYNIFMTLVVLPINLTIGNYSGGHFNILSKRRDRGSINSLKSMAKLISLKIYQSNLSFIIFCPRLFAKNNKRFIKTIFYSFRILNKSPITKIYLYRPVIRNGIRSKKIPRK
jgi:hypothetical protein